MSDYYLDIETYQPNPETDFYNDKIIAITYRQIDCRTGETKGNLNILKSWETSQKEILEQFYNIFPSEKKDKFKFVAIGDNLPFDLGHLALRWKFHGFGINAIPLFCEHPYIDISSLLVLMNAGNMGGASLHKFGGTKWTGSAIAEWYTNKDYASIIAYIENESTCYLNLYKFMVKHLPGLWTDYAKEAGIIK